MYHDEDGQDETWYCTHCHAEVDGDADFCPACGASEDSGWDTDTVDEDDDYEDDFDYDDYLRREFPDHADPDAAPQRGRQFFVAIVVLLVIAFLLMSLFGF